MARDKGETLFSLSLSLSLSPSPLSRSLVLRQDCQSRWSPALETRLNEIKGKYLHWQIERKGKGLDGSMLVAAVQEA